MAERNLPYTYPEQAAGKLDIETLKVREIEIASADTAYYRQHGLVEKRATAEQCTEAKLAQKQSWRRSKVAGGKQ